MIKRLLIAIFAGFVLGAASSPTFAQAAAEYSAAAASAAASAANAGAALGQATQQAAGRVAQSLGSVGQAGSRELGRAGRVPRRGVVRQNGASPVAPRDAAAACAPAELETLGSTSGAADSRVINLGSKSTGSASEPKTASGTAANPQGKTAGALESKPKADASLPPCPPRLPQAETQYKSVINLSFPK